MDRTLRAGTLSIRAKLIVWFLLAAILPAAVIAVFVTFSASNRFITQAREELHEARRRGQAQVEEIKNEVRDTVRTLALGSVMQSHFDREELSPARIVDAGLAQRVRDSTDNQLDFFKVLGQDGVVISSLEWLVFAGKVDLEWDRIQEMKDDSFIIGPVRTDREDILGIRYKTTAERLTIVGGAIIDERVLSQFGAAKDIVVYLYNGVSHELVSNEPIQGLTEELVLNEIITTGDGGELKVGGRRYLISHFPLSETNLQVGAVFFFYGTEPLNQEINGLWTSFFLAAVVGVLLATLLGMLVAANVSNPLRKLLYAFELVSLGDFSHTLETRRSDELGEILRSFNRTTDDLNRLQDQLIRSERVAAWQEIARKIAHEIKNPLSPIQISIETMQKVYRRQHPDFERIFNESSKTIVEEVEKIRAIVQEFSDFARMPEPYFEEVSLQGIINHIVTLYQHADESINWTVDVPGQLPSIFADENQLQRALMNVIKNSLEAMPEGGEITIRARYQKASSGRSGSRKHGRGKIHLQIIDTGVGMSPENLTRVFTPYFTTKDSGTGLGLVIVQKVIELHKGRLSLQSTEGEGTVVDIVLPERL